MIYYKFFFLRKKNQQFFVRTIEMTPKNRNISVYYIFICPHVQIIRIHIIFPGSTFFFVPREKSIITVISTNLKKKKFRNSGSSTIDTRNYYRFSLRSNRYENKSPRTKADWQKWIEMDFFLLHSSLCFYTRTSLVSVVRCKLRTPFTEILMISVFKICVRFSPESFVQHWIIIVHRLVRRSIWTLLTTLILTEHTTIKCLYSTIIDRLDEYIHSHAQARDIFINIVSNFFFWRNPKCTKTRL